MHGLVHRLLERGDQRNYNEWLRIQQEISQLSHSQAEARCNSVLAQTQEVTTKGKSSQRSARQATNLKSRQSQHITKVKHLLRLDYFHCM